MLHDWGTVCGLEVSCDPCGGSVRVSTGYAIDPCGNDIVVCAPDAVDVCGLIDDCVGRERREVDCRPYGADLSCPDAYEDWILALEYAEVPQRGISPLRGPDRRKASCGCGGCGSGACSCETSSAAPPATMPRRAPAECEPTVQCESYRYTVFRAPKVERRKKPGGSLFELDFGDAAMAKRFACCLQPLIDGFPDAPGSFALGNYDAQPAAWNSWARATKQMLASHLMNSPGYDCGLLAELKAIECPREDAVNFGALFEATAEALLRVVERIALDCLCGALLPACPAPTHDRRVPLASVRVRRGAACSVLSVCNWTPLRKVAMTMPNLRYWLAPFGIARLVRTLFHQLCCPGEPEKFRMEDPPAGYDGEEKLGKQRIVISNSLQRDPAEFNGRAFSAGLMGQSVNGEALYLDANDRALLPQLMLFERIARPAFAGAGIDGVLRVAAKVMKHVGKDAEDGLAQGLGAVLSTDQIRDDVEKLRKEASTQDEEMSKLKSRVDERVLLERLTRLVESQGRKIEELEKKLEGSR